MYTKEELENSTAKDLRKLATREFEVKGASKYSKDELIKYIMEVQEKQDRESFQQEMMEMSDDGFYDFEIDENGEPVGESKKFVDEMFDESELTDDFDEEQLEDEISETSLRAKKKTPNVTETPSNINIDNFEQLSLDVDGVMNESTDDEEETPKEKPLKESDIRFEEMKKLSPEELAEERKRSLAKARGQKIVPKDHKKAKQQKNTKKVKDKSKLLGLLMFVALFVIVDVLTLLAEAVYYTMWLGEDVDIITQLVALAISTGFVAVIKVTGQGNDMCEGAKAIIDDIDWRLFSREE